MACQKLFMHFSVTKWNSSSIGMTYVWFNCVLIAINFFFPSKAIVTLGVYRELVEKRDVWKTYRELMTDIIMSTIGLFIE